MKLKEEISKIVELQTIDSQIHTLSREIEIEKPAIVEQIKKDIESNKQTIADFEEKHKKAQLKKKEIELDLESKEENLRKAQGHLYQLKTNKEYQAKLTEISSFKADISVIEEALLGVLDEIEAARSDQETETARILEKEKTYQSQIDQLQSETKDLKAQADALQDKRKSYSGQIKPELLDSYEKLLGTRQGLAIVPVKSNNCGACHMMVTHQKVNEIKMYSHLTFCENCVRVLYVPEDIET